jgi:hypothetical protein
MAFLAARRGSSYKPIDPGVPAFWWAILGHSQVLINLIGNAIRYGSRRVTVSAWTELKRDADPAARVRRRYRRGDSGGEAVQCFDAFVQATDPALAATAVLVWVWPSRRTW